MNSALRAKLAEIAQYNRSYPRHSVLFKGRLHVNAYEFSCKVADISLGGARIRLDLPLAVDAPVELAIQGHRPLSATVVWIRDGFIGLRFKVEPPIVLQTLGAVGKKLLS